MQNFKNKLYNYETPPPVEIWKDIAEELQKEKMKNKPDNRKSTFIFFAAAAASVIIIFLGSLFLKKNHESMHEPNIATKVDRLLAQKLQDSISLNQKILESIIHNPKEKKEIVSNRLSHSTTKKYLTVAGPEGEPIRISPKVATLIISTDHEFPPKPIWSKKITKWQKIMLSSTISPTSANFVDLMEVAANDDKLE